MSPIRMSRLESAVRVVLEFYDAFDRQDKNAMMELLTDDCIFEDASPAPEGSRYSGKEEIGRGWQELFRMSPSTRIEIEEVFGVGTRCVGLWKHEWIEESGERAYVRGVDIFRVRNGLISQKSSYVKGQ